jgi:hypothetical protein
MGLENAIFDHILGKLMVYENRWTALAHSHKEFLEVDRDWVVVDLARVLHPSDVK